MKILVTGGAGFIGSALIRYVLENTTHDVVNVDKLTYAGNQNSIPSSDYQDRYKLYAIDICDMGKLESVFNEEQPDCVMHLAAESHVDRSIDGPESFIQTNIVGTFCLLQVSRKYFTGLCSEKQSLFKFHHISTDEVFGDLPHPEDSEFNNECPQKFTERSPYSPSSPYSASKASSDMLVRSWFRTFGLPVVVSNCSNNYGPYHFPEKLIPITIINAIEGRDISIYGSGKQIRDWLFVEDHVKALLLILTEGKVGETYNVGGKNEIQNIEVVNKICHILDSIRPTTESYSKQIKHVNDRPGHDKRYAIDTSKIERDLGWYPIESFESGLEKTVKWYLNNEKWWRDLITKTYQLDRLGLGKDLL